MQPTLEFVVSSETCLTLISYIFKNMPLSQASRVGLNWFPIPKVHSSQPILAHESEQVSEWVSEWVVCVWGLEWTLDCAQTKDNDKVGVD